MQAFPKPKPETDREAANRRYVYSSCARGAPCAGTHNANYFPRPAPDDYRILDSSAM